MNPVRSRGRSLRKKYKMKYIKFINIIKHSNDVMTATCPVRSYKYLHTILNFNHYQLIKAASNGACF